MSRWQDLKAGQEAITEVRISTRESGGSWALPLMAKIGQSDGPTLAVIAGVHGDEYVGIMAIPALYKEISPDQLAGKLIMIPVVNPAAFEASTRNNPVDDKNLARVFPGHAKGSLSDRIAHWLTEDVLQHADLFIDLHTGGTHGYIPNLVGYIGGEDAVAQRSRAAAEAYNAPVIWGHPPPCPPGRSISAALDLGVPTLYTECLDKPHTRKKDVEIYQTGVRNVMIHMGMLDMPLTTRPLEYDLYGDGNLDFVIEASEAGIFTPQVDLLEDVRAGQKLGTVRDVTGHMLEEVTSPHDGVVIMINGCPRVRAGQSVLQVTQYRPETRK